MVCGLSVVLGHSGWRPRAVRARAPCRRLPRRDHNPKHPEAKHHLNPFSGLFSDKQATKGLDRKGSTTGGDSHPQAARVKVYKV